MEYRIQSGETVVTVSDLGAELISVKTGNEERLWQNPTGEWGGHAPLLFPVAGRCGVTVNGTSYPIGMHGVARKAIFTLTEQTKNSITLALHSNESTRAVYPFEFVFSVTYSIDENKLSIVYEVENPSEQTTYYAGGCHESYALKTDVDGYEIEFETTESLTRLLHNDNGKLTGETLVLGEMQTMPLDKEGLSNGDTYVFEDIRSRCVVLKERGGKAIARVSFPDYPNLLFWHADGAHYICIEPWLNLPDTEGKETVEFTQKKGVRALAPKAKARLVHTIEYL